MGAVTVLAVTFMGLSVPTGAFAAATARPGSRPKLWSKASTWDGSRPGRGDSVTIPRGAHVVLDVSPPPLGNLEVNGTLEFGSTDIRLRAQNIMVHGTFRIGSRRAPYRNHATITLTEPNRATDLMGMGGRVIGVMGGALEMWGQPRVSWTQLDATALAGATTIRLARDVDWRRGDRIAIASTDYSSHHADEATVASVEGRTVQLEEPLSYAHFGELQHFGTHTLDERAEVALLSHNIVIEGARDSATDGYGGQIMIEHGGRARIRGVELANMGQLSRLRRYPVHFHMHGDGAGSSIKDSSIHHSFNRCVTIHGTDSLLLSNNVCYDHMGHGFFLEDGAETDNVFRRNLGFQSRAVTKDPLLPTDEHPATFWITNPDNTFVGNHAAGSDGYGFWYALPEHPTGLSSNQGNVWPRRTPLKAFRDNVAHSNGNSGLNVDDGPRPDGHTETTYYDPVRSSSDLESEGVVASFENFTAYKNRDRGAWLRGENHVVTGTFADNRVAATFASSESFLKDSVVVGFSANEGTQEAGEAGAPDGRELPLPWDPAAPIHGFEFYGGRVGVISTSFYEFEADSLRPAAALGYLEPNALPVDPSNFVDSVHFEDANPVHFPDPDPGMDGDFSRVFVDRDGSVTGTAGHSVVADNPFLLDDSCRFEWEWNAHVCDTDYVSLMVGTLDNDPEDVRPVTLKRPDGVVQTLNGCCDDSVDAWTSVIAGQTYGVRFAATTARGIRLAISDGPGEYVIVKVQQPPGFEVMQSGSSVPQASVLSALDGFGEPVYFYDRDLQTLYLRINGGESDLNEIQVRPR